MSLVRQLLILALLAAAAGGGWYLWRETGARETAGASGFPQAADAPAPVIVEQVRMQSDAAVINAIGTGRALRAVELTPEATGRVVDILFTAGDHAEEGAPLLKLDEEDERLAVRLAEVALEDARQTLERYERAAPSGAVSATEVDSARTAVESAEIELQQAELALARRTVRAPFDGVLGIPEIDVGDRIGEETVIASFDDSSVLLVDFAVPESFLYGVEEGGRVELSTWARPGERFDGEITAVGSRVDTVARNLQVRARTDNAAGRLKPGMSFTVVMPLRGDRFPSVPSIAVRWERDGAFVWAVREAQATRVPVEVLKRSDDWVLVDADLDASDRVVVEGLQRLRPGREVEIVGGEAIAAVAGPTDGG